MIEMDWKKILTEVFRRFEFLDMKTERIEINFNNGQVCDLKIVTRER